ncbi:MAG TPA: thioredoxin domain-containing protein, partial [Thermoclostridium sp.]|nr:thioredoxin domain-containing protein [Thermoclostridium sp.]
KKDRHGHLGFISILNNVQTAWIEKRDVLENAGNQIIDAVYNEDYNEQASLNKEIVHNAYQQLERSFDPEYGGFGRAPKFPTPHNLLFLLRYWYATGEGNALRMVEKTLDCMYRGGIYDHIGFGFSRYSTDRYWLIPHFEKMLYDNALLSMVFAETYHATGNDKYAQIAKDIYKYILRDMTSDSGAFYSAEDADSEGIEGLFYVWEAKEIISILGKEDGRLFCDMFDITSSGNFEGHNIPNLIHTKEIDVDFIEKCRGKLFHTREKRIHPFKDDKILTSWNALMAASFAIGGRILKDESLVDAAKEAISFINSNLTRQDGRLLVRFRDGDADILAFLDDYAYLQWAYIELYQSTFEPEYLEDAIAINDEINRLFLDTDKGGFFLYGHDAEKLISRPKDAYDGAMPSANSVMAMNMVRLARITGDIQLVENYETHIQSFGRQLSSSPLGYIYMLTSFLTYTQPSQEVILVSGTYKDSLSPFMDVLHDIFRPFTTTVVYDEKYKQDEKYRTIESIIPYISNYRALDGKAQAYICENFACKQPVSDINEFNKLMS